LRKDMQIELKRLQHETGITFIFVTHDQEEALTMSDRIAVMNKGRILQVGAPRMIYERPSERFVANFIGESNFLKGTAVPARQGLTRVDLACGGSLELSAVEPVEAPCDVTVVVRPENAALVQSQFADFSGVVENIVYFGTDTHLHVRLKDSTLFTLRKQNISGVPLGIAVGGTAGIALAQGAAWMIRDRDG
jgi:spermidine/putrescine transport system ATP-binding protein